MARADSATFLRLVRNLLAGSLTLAVGGLLLVAVVVPRLGGATPYVIETGSMRPGMPPGTLVVVRPVDASQIAIGSVITYQVRSGEQLVVTHRVVGTGMDATGHPVFRTQGDANNAPDDQWVRPVQVRGERWYAVPLIGRVTTLVSARAREALIAGVVVLLLVYAAVMVGADLRNRRRSEVRHG
jgi:signal peptidase